MKEVVVKFIWVKSVFWKKETEITTVAAQEQKFSVQLFRCIATKSTYPHFAEHVRNLRKL